jgi:hypothetical protein
VVIALNLNAGLQEKILVECSKGKRRMSANLQSICARCGHPICTATHKRPCSLGEVRILAIGNGMVVLE